MRCQFVAAKVTDVGLVPIGGPIYLEVPELGKTKLTDKGLEPRTGAPPWSFPEDGILRRESISATHPDSSGEHYVNRSQVQPLP